MSLPAPFISIVSPVYNSAAIVSELVRRIDQAVSAIDKNYEIILVDDGSTDDSLQQMVKAQSVGRLIVCKLRENVGQHYAIRAGLELAGGTWVVVMDCDLQDNPDNINLLLQQAQLCGQSVLAHRLTKKNRLYYVWSSYLLNSMLSLVTGSYFDYRTGNFGVFHQSLIHRLLELPVHDFYFPVAVRRVLPSIPSVKVIHENRFAGSSTYNFSRQWKLAIRAIRYSRPTRMKLAATGHQDYSVETVISTKFEP
jgi:glycosyltransferase involved in cell wall biosynthesis